MVYNKYSGDAMHLMSRWDPNDLRVELNAIDPYVESKRSLRVVINLLFLVGQREEVDSMLWGFKNTHYSEIIKKAEDGLRILVDRFLAEQIAQTSLLLVFLFKGAIS